MKLKIDEMEAIIAALNAYGRFLGTGGSLMDTDEVQKRLGMHFRLVRKLEQAIGDARRREAKKAKPPKPSPPPTRLVNGKAEVAFDVPTDANPYKSREHKFCPSYEDPAKLCGICGNEAYHPLHIPGQRKRHEFEPALEVTKTPGGLTVEEWVEYWREGNGQFEKDGIQLDQFAREDLAFASDIISKLL